MLHDSSGDPYSSSKTNFGPRIAMTWSPNPNGNRFFGGGKTVLRGGFGIYYGPGQTEDQIQPIESNRISSTISGGAFPQDTNAIVANFINNPNNRSFQPRAYAPDYTLLSAVAAARCSGSFRGFSVKDFLSALAVPGPRSS